MSEITHTFKIQRVQTLPQVNEHTNVVVRVHWTVEFLADGIQSLGAGDTVLDTTAIESFTPVDQITEQQMVDWVVAAEGGQAFLDSLGNFHAQQIRRGQIDAQAVDANLPFVAADAAESSGSSVFAPIFPTPTSGSIGTTVFE